MSENGETRRGWLVLVGAVLSANAGFINAVFLLSLVNPVSHATGSLSEIAMSITAGDIRGLALMAVILVGFFGGAMAGGTMLGRPFGTGRRYGVALLVQAALLAVAPVVVTAERVIVGAALGAAATGLQNAMSSNYRGMAVRTSHMTGTLTDLGVFLGRGDHRKNGQRWKGHLLASTLVTFIVGGGLGAYGAGEVDIYALWAPAACCTVLGLTYGLYRHRQHRTTRTLTHPETTDDTGTSS